MGDLFDGAHRQELNQSHIRELINRLGLVGINRLREVIYVTAIHDHDPRTHRGETTYSVNGIKVRVIQGIAKFIIGSINSELRIANTGSWINRFINTTDTAVIINGLGNVELVRVKCGP